MVVRLGSWVTGVYHQHVLHSLSWKGVASNQTVPSSLAMPPCPCACPGTTGETVHKDPRLKMEERIPYSNRDIMGEPQLPNTNSSHWWLEYDLGSDVTSPAQGLVSTLVASRAPSSPECSPTILSSFCQAW